MKEKKKSGAGGIQEIWTTLFALSLDKNSSQYVSIDNTGVGFYYLIPWNYLSNYLSVSKQYKYILSYSYQGTQTQGQVIQCYFGGATSADAIYNSIQKQNIETQEAINNMNDNIMDSNVENSSIELPTININDPTYSFLDTLFTSFYNAFCSGTAPDVVFPFPNTRKEFYFV